MTILETRDAAVRELLALNPMQLAAMSEHGQSPDSADSEGARYLTRVRDAVCELISEMDVAAVDVLMNEPSAVDDDGSVHELADSAVPIYTHNRWEMFVDLCAYNVDISDYEGERDLTESAGVALYVLALDVAWALLNEASETIKGATTDEDD